MGAYLADQGKVDPSQSMQIGLRGHPRTFDWLQPSYDYGYNVVTMADYRAREAADVIEQIKATLAGGPVYITFDLDCLDPTVAPAVANIEPGVGGFGIDEAMALPHAVRGMNIIGGDVVCLMPTKDHPNQITAMVAAAVMFEMIASRWPHLPEQVIRAMTNPLYDRLFGCHEGSTDPFLRLPDGSVMPMPHLLRWPAASPRCWSVRNSGPATGWLCRWVNHLKRWRSMRRRSGRVLSSCRSIGLYCSGNGIFHHRQRCPHGGDRG